MRPDGYSTIISKFSIGINYYWFDILSCTCNCNYSKLCSQIDCGESHCRIYFVVLLPCFRGIVFAQALTALSHSFAFGAIGTWYVGRVYAHAAQPYRQCVPIYTSLYQHTKVLTLATLPTWFSLQLTPYYCSLSAHFSAVWCLSFSSTLLPHLSTGCLARYRHTGPLQMASVEVDWVMTCFELRLHRLLSHLAIPSFP